MTPSPVSPMTRRNTEAGRELDALIAEKVMGGKAFPARQPTREGSYGTREYDLTQEPVFDWIPPSGILSELPEFSTDIAAAWLVVEKMRDNGHLANIGHGQGDLPARRIFFADFISRRKRTHESAETLPLAICRAALLSSPLDDNGVSAT